MHSKPQKKTAERLTYRASWKSCLPAKTKAGARMRPPFLQRSCVLRSRFEAVLKGSEKPFYYDLHLCKTPIHKQFCAGDVANVVGCEKLTHISLVRFHSFGVQLIALPSLRRRPARFRW